MIQVEKIALKAPKSATIRDVFRVMFLPNHRLDSTDLAFENSPHMVRQKFHQLIDVMFGVHDPQGAQLAAALKEAADAVTAAKRTESTLDQLAREDYPMGVIELQRLLREAADTIAAVSVALENLDAMQRTNLGAISQMRSQLTSAQRAASAAAVRLRDRSSLLTRLASLRAQYADDKKKLTFLKEAERLFNPLDVTCCPACLSDLAVAPKLVNGVCSLCHAHVRSPDDDVSSPSDEAERFGERDLIDSELRAVSRRLNDLNDYWVRLDNDRARLEHELEDAEADVERLAAALDRVATTPAPWLAQRDALTTQRAEARLAAQSADIGLRVWQRASDARERRERLDVALARLRENRSASRNRPDREAVVRALSDRFASILTAFEYPKLSDASIGRDLVPRVRGMHYTKASSGGLVLISLAYHLAIWELAFERGADAPGLLVIDSPQKNLGHGVLESDPDFADTRLVENFYRHVQGWLAGDGKGAQVVIIDNSPPDLVRAQIVVQYTRSVDTPPYGLITDAVD